ncbi:unnamed protein product, partial [Rotaria sp. Silwood2]
MSIEHYATRNVSVSPDDKKTVTIACAKYCAFDMRSFNSVHGNGFKQLCQVLIDIGYKHGSVKLNKPSANILLPDRTNISRTVKQIANEYRSKINKILRQDLERVKLIGISTDYWKGNCSGDTYLTINIHYTKDDDLMTYMLKTILFSGTKSGENTIQTIKMVLKSYDIDPDGKHIIYLTDNASNFISGLKEEVHLRCICTQHERNDVHKATKDILKTLNITEQNEEIIPINPTISAAKSRKTSKRIKRGDCSEDDVMMEFAQENQTDSSEGEDENEVDRYAKAKLVINNEEKVLNWWKKWAITYPKLSILDRSLFGISASSCTSERIFSTIGRILEERRQNFSDDIIDDMLFIRNFKKVV